MNAFPRSEDGVSFARSERYHRWRRIQDQLTRRLISLGGISVILAVVLILFYLVYVVLPLFLPASAERLELGRQADWAATRPVYTALEEQREIGLRVGADGTADFFQLDGLQQLQRHPLTPAGTGIVLAAEAPQGNGTVALAADDGQVLLFRHRYETDFADGVAQRRVVPAMAFPYGLGWRPLAPGEAITALAVSDSDAGVVIAAAVDGTLRVEISLKQENFLTGEVSLTSTVKLAAVDFRVSGLALSGNHRWLYASDDQGRIHVYRLPDLEPVEQLQIVEAPITAMNMLLGGISVLAGDARGGISQLFPVRDDQNEYTHRVVRRFDGQSGAIVSILPEYRRKGFAAIDRDGGLGIYHTTAGQMVLERSLAGGAPLGAALSPRANGLALFSADGRVSMLGIDNQHPEVSISSLWRKVWYENYAEPQYVWQSSAATNEFEPKFSLTPLAFGTLKAALFAMLFAVPLSLMGAAYTAYFMAPRLRELVKPTIEIMAALPTVILGFLAGLWFAPFIEDHLAAIVSILLVLPVGLLLFAYGWSHYLGRLKRWVAPGWEPVLLLPVLVLLVFAAMQLANPLQQLFFGGDLRDWLSQEMGISYDQRNALVVGFAMGFAVIPTIFSMAEDAVFGVPQSLSDGSLALGATSWQTLVRVILPTASPGIFSALMIGLGRAVGETMIVLMATGNTPVMDWSIFEGMRTLAANIAVEMPESEVDSSHYRILFLAALVLFMFTFVVNTGAELIRQRLRERYSSL
jgi:phosphate transport system permease protein